MRKKRGTKRPVILYAVDPLARERALNHRGMRVLGPIVKKLSGRVQPIGYVDSFSGVGEFTRGGKKISFVDMDEIVPPDLSSMAEDLVLISHKGAGRVSLREKVVALDKEAQRRRALFIALHTHARSGLKRILMGSFAETMLLYSRTPVVIFSPHCALPREIRHVLFATDFSAESIRAFNRVLPSIGLLGATVTIAHYFHVPPPASLFGYDDELVHYNDELKTRMKRVTKVGTKLEQRCRLAGVKAQFLLLDDRGVFDPSGAILKWARSNEVDLIALAAQSSALKTTFIGATSREIARAAHCPVWILRK